MELQAFDNDPIFQFKRVLMMMDQMCPKDFNPIGMFQILDTFYQTF